MDPNSPQQGWRVSWACGSYQPFVGDLREGFKASRWFLTADRPLPSIRALSYMLLVYFEVQGSSSLLAVMPGPSKVCNSIGLLGFVERSWAKIPLYSEPQHRDPYCDCGHSSTILTFFCGSRYLYPTEPQPGQGGRRRRLRPSRGAQTMAVLVNYLLL